jgi:tetratricopeptide (TPR) repeat protein
MNEEKDWLFEENELLESIRRFEEMQKKSVQYFFDVHELEDIINYYFDLNNYQQASMAAEYALNIYPESTVIQLKFAQHLIYSGKIEESLPLLDYIEKVEGSNYEIYVLKGTAFNLLDKTSEARSYFDKAVTLSSDNRDEVLYSIGISFEDRGQFEVALDYFREAYRLNNENISVLYDLAFSSERAGLLDDSVMYYNKYLDEDPFSENVWYNLAIIYTLHGKVEDALQAYDYSIALNEGFSSSYYNKGNLLFNEERYEESLKVYLEFLELEPNNLEIYNYIGECYLKLEQNETAISYIKHAIELDENSADSWHNLANAYLNNNSLDEALKCIKKALKLENTNTQYLYTLANILRKQKDFISALKTIRHLTEIDPSDEDAWMFYSEILVETQQLDDAIKALNKALGFIRESSVINYRIGSYYMLKGNEKLSFKYLKKGLSINYQERQFFFDFVPEANDNPKIIEILRHYN